MIRNLIVPIVYLILLIRPSLALDSCDGDCENGFGRINLKDGLSYEGFFQNKKFHGRGLLKGTVRGKSYSYSGEWYQNKRQGYGTQFFSSGGRYIGEWRADKMTGKGTFTSVLGSCDFFEAIFHENGISAPAKHEEFNVDYCIYDGAWLENLPSGDGALTIKFDAVRVLDKNVYDFIRKNENFLSYLFSLQKYDRLPALIEIIGKWRKARPQDCQAIVKDGKGKIFMQQRVMEADLEER